MAFRRQKERAEVQPDPFAKADEHIRTSALLGFAVTQLVFQRWRVDHAKPAYFLQPSAILCRNEVLPITFEFHGGGKGAGEIDFEMAHDDKGPKWHARLDLPDEQFDTLFAVCNDVADTTEWQIFGTIRLEGPYSKSWHPVKCVEAERRRIFGAAASR
jgi:hypothetical protein